VNPVDWKTFTASLVSSLAWPSVMVALLIVLRKQIGGLAERLQELSLPGGAKATFEKQLETARKEAGNLAAPSAEPQTNRLVPEPEERKFLRLAAASPESAVMQAYKRIEGVLSKIAPLLHLDTDNALLVANELLQREFIDSGTLALFNTLRQARDIAAQVGPGRITPSEALDYGEHTDKLSGILHYVLGRLEGRKGLPHRWSAE
jgi:hypothetical protein